MLEEPKIEIEEQKQKSNFKNSIKVEKLITFVNIHVGTELCSFK